MTELMTPIEVTERLKTEDALDLSVEKWERIVAVLEKSDEYNPLSCTDVASETCALCRIHEGGFHGCPTCPYQKHYGFPCDSDDGSWSPLWDYPIGHALRKAKEMLDDLVQLRKPNVQ